MERAEKHGQEAGQLADRKVIPQASDGQPPWIPLGTDALGASAWRAVCTSACA